MGCLSRAKIRLVKEPFQSGRVQRHHIIQAGLKAAICDSTVWVIQIAHVQRRTNPHPISKIRLLWYNSITHLMHACCHGHCVSCRSYLCPASNPSDKLKPPQAVHKRPGGPRSTVGIGNRDGNDQPCLHAWCWTPGTVLQCPQQVNSHGCQGLELRQCEQHHARTSTSRWRRRTRMSRRGGKRRRREKKKEKERGKEGEKRTAP